MKWENNDLVMKVHDEVKGLPLDDTVSFPLDPHQPQPTTEKKGESVDSHRGRDMNDFC